jgi:isopenicillin N synthase-like dioxygenase
LSIQVVDFQSNNAASEFERSLRETGFGVVTNHPIDSGLVNEVFTLWEQFFTTDVKDDPEYAFSSKTHNGFIPLELSETAKGKTVKDLKMFYHYYYGRGVIPKFLQEKTDLLCKQLIQMAETLLKWVEANMPEEIRVKLSEHLTRMIADSDKTLFRPIYYPALNGDEPVEAVRAAEHEDIDFLTLLPAATAKGLQAKNLDGSWVDVPCNPGWIIINAGDMLQEATDHYYPSTTHRVVNPEGDEARKARMSMPLFLHPRDEVRLSDRHTAGSYREERFRELGLLAEDESLEA